MIRRYGPTETVFNHNKFVLHPLTAYVRETANEMFELEMELKKEIIINKRDIVVAPSPRGEQPFRVYRIKKTLRGKKVYARHLFYDLAKSFLIDTRPTNATVQDALQSIFTAIGSQGFTYLSDITDRRTAYYIRKNPVEAIIGADNSVLNTWGGNLIRDGKEIKILAEGIDRGFEIRLGKNLIGIEDDSDDSSVVTKLYPTVVIDQVVRALPEKYVDSPLIGSYETPITKEVRIALSDDEELLPIADIYTLMRTYCQNLYSVDNVDKPIANYTVDFVQLKKIARLNQEIKYTYEGLEQLTYETIETLTYEQLEGTEVINQFIDLLEKLDIHDLVTIRVKELDIDLKAKVIDYLFDCLQEKFDSIELGGFKPSNKYQTENIIQRLANDINVSKDEMAKLWDVAVNVVTGNKGGYKIERLNANKQPYETLYMDTPDINTAQSILRINNAGIAGTTNGFNGPYEVAITSDGWVLAERILAYQLSAISADLGTVTAGKLQSDNGKVFLDLETGYFNFDNKMKWDGAAFSINIAGSDIESSINSKEAAILKQSSAPAHVAGRLWLDTSATPNILKRSTGSAWVKVTPTTAGEVGAYGSLAGQALETPVANYNAGKLNGQKYNFDGTGFTIGGATGDVAKHTSAESKYNHTDGSYTKVSAAGLEIYKAGTNSKYKALVYSGKISSNSYPGADSSGQAWDVTLPAEFDSLTDLKVYAWISRAKQTTGSNTIKSMEAVIGTITKGADNLIRFRITWTVVFSGTADATIGEVSFMAIA